MVTLNELLVCNRICENDDKTTDTCQLMDHPESSLTFMFNRRLVFNLGARA
jgi:hypothetical protein